MFSLVQQAAVFPVCTQAIFEALLHFLNSFADTKPLSTRLKVVDPFRFWPVAFRK
jgi:hypothetical protein